MRRQAKAICIAAASAAGALAASHAPLLAEIRLEPFVDVDEAFSDNVDRDPDGQEETAFITEVETGTKFRWTSRLANAAFNLSVRGRHQTAGDNSGSEVQVLPDVAGFSSFELWENHLFLDASAAVSNELLNTRSQNTDSNRDIVQTYAVTPRLRGSFGNFADAHASYTLNQVFDEDSSGLGDNTTHTIGTSLTAGPDFTRVRWTLSGSASEAQRTDDPDVSRREVKLDLEYIVDRSFSLLGGTGYQTFDDGDPGNDFSSIEWDVGLRWRPGSRTDVTMSYGKRDNEKNFAADIRYAISPRTRVFATYDETLLTGQERLIQDLSLIATDPNTGVLIDTRTGLPFDTSSSITTVDNNTKRTRTLSTGLNGVRGRNTFGVVGTVSFSRDEGGATPGADEDAYDVSVNWARQLSPDTSLGVDASYARNEFEIDNRTDNEYSTGVSYTYSINRNLSAVGRYSFAKQNSTSAADEFVENQVTLGIRMTF